MNVELRLEPKGPTVAREEVTPADLADARAEAWWNGVLRKGFPDVPLDAVDLALRPLFSEGRCAGSPIEPKPPAGPPPSSVSSRTFLEPVAARAAARMIRAGTLQAGDLYYYTLAAEDRTERLPRGGPPAPPHITRPLAPLLERAEPVGETADGLHAILYTRDARAAAARIARRGARDSPPVETGGVLVGALCSCPASGEMFVAIVDVLEAADAERKTFSLSFSGSTWARLAKVMAARRRARPADLPIGQSHGHNFSAGEPCEICSTVDVCTKTTAFLSSDDLTWCRAVFSAQPWQVSHIFGYSARKEEVDAFYGQEGGELARRGYHLVDSLEV